MAVNATIGKGAAKRQTTTWFNVTTLRRERAEPLVSYIKSGMQVLVTGEVAVSPYIDKNGKPAASLEVNANDMQLLTGKEEMERRSGYQPSAEIQGESADTADIPF